MKKALIPTKIKDGLFILTVCCVIMFGSLYVDAVKGVLRGNEIDVKIYLEGSAVNEMLADGNVVNVFRRAIGKIDRVSFFAAEVKRPSEVGQSDLEGLPGTPEQLLRLHNLKKELRVAADIITGVRLDCRIYPRMMGDLMPLFGKDTKADIAASGMLGEPFLQIYPGSKGGGLKDGDRIGFPRNDPDAFPEGGGPELGQELAGEQAVIAAIERQRAFREKVAEFERILEEIIAAQSRPAGAPEPDGPPAAGEPPESVEEPESSPSGPPSTDDAEI